MHESPKPSQFLLQYQTPVARRSKELAAIEIESDDCSSNEENETEYSNLRHKPKNEDKDNITDEPAPKKRRQSISPEPSEYSQIITDEVEIPSDGPEILLSALHPNCPFSSTPQKRSASINAPRFLIPSSNPRSVSQVLSESSIFAKPPQFRSQVPPYSQNPESDLDPDQFSPRRKGEKYINGGLAAELRNWLVNIKSSMLVTYAMNNKPWLMKVLIEEFVEEGKGRMTLIKGNRLEGSGDEVSDVVGTVRIILAGQASSIGLQKSSPIKNGGIVGVKGPLWEVSIEGEMWTVGVDWQLI